VIGLGYVGLPLAVRFSQEGFQVIGFDLDKEKTGLINEGKSYINHINEDDIAAAVKNYFIATTDFSKVANIDTLIICVPTPLYETNVPDLSFIQSTLKNIKPYLKENQLLVLESTTYPGTTEEVLVPFIDSVNNKKFTLGSNFFIGYSPEREDPGNTKFSTKTIPKIVSGVTEKCLELTKCLYDQIVDKTVPVSTPKVAEMTKILENIHRAVNIGLVNELKIIADKMGIDIYEVIEAAATKPFGFTSFYPGPGLGGHCIPIDPFYLSWRAKQFGIDTKFIELAGEINSNMPQYVVEKVISALSTINQTIKDSRILILGLAYKKNIDDSRESPSLKIIDLLRHLDANIEYSDPFFAQAPKTRKYSFDLKNTELNKNNLKSFDLVILVTDHDEFDYDLILKESKLIVDTRNKFKKSKKVFKA